MLYLLAEENIPDNAVDVLLWPVGLVILAGVIFYAGWWVENRLTKAPWKWAALAPIAWGIYLGCGYVGAYREPVYNGLVTASGGEKKMLVAHYGSLIIPILGLIGIILFHFFNHKLNLPTDD